MKRLSENVKQVLSTGDLMYFHLVKIGPFKDVDGSIVTWKHTQVPGGVTIGEDVYTDVNSLTHVDPPRQSAAVDRESFKIVYSDAEFALRPTFESGFSGVPVEVSIGFYNTTDYNLSGIPPGYILTNPADVLMIYAGSTDSPSYSIDPKGDVTVTIECTSPMGALMMVRTLQTNKEILQQINPADTSYDELFVGSKGLTLLWGKRT
jgi:hypothetical protein